MIEAENKPGIWNLTIEIGRFFAIPFRFSEDTEIDVSESEFKSQIRNSAGALIAEFTIEKDETDNSIELTLESTDTTAENSGIGVWDLMIIDPPQTIIRGEVRIIMPSTRIDEPEP